jgi:hypothetical protein
LEQKLWSSRPAGKLLTISTLIIVVGLIILVGARWEHYQWDFRMFYGSATFFAQGVSPYRGSGLSFYHPPLMLYFYKLFTVLPVYAASTLWYALKLVALAALLAVWSRNFLRLRLEWPTICFMALAYNGAIYADLVSGNLSVFEQLLLWVGFSQLLRRRYARFGLCLILASQVKITPILFSVLLLVAPARPQWRWFFASIAGFALVFSLNYWLEPELFARFWHVSALLDERGIDNNSSLALIRDVADRVQGAAVSSGTYVDELVFVTFAGAAALLSLKTILSYRQRGANMDARLVIYFSCIAYGLVSPRFKVYTYILLLVPTLYLVRAHWRGLVAPLASVALVLLVIFPQGNSLLPIRAAFELFNDYLALFGCLAVWFSYVHYFSRPADAADAPSWLDSLASRPLQPGFAASASGLMPGVAGVTQASPDARASPGASP